MVQGDHQVALIRLQRLRASPLPAACPSRCEARLGPFLDKMPLKLGQGRKEMERQFAAGRGRIDRFMQTLEANAVLLKRGHPLDEIFDRTP